MTSKRRIFRAGAQDLLLALKALRYCHLHGFREVWGSTEPLWQLLEGEEASQGPKMASIRGFLETDSLYVHVAKSAGISVLHALYGNIGLAHTSIRQYRQLFRDSFLERAFVFTTVRNPWDRIYSAYSFLKAGGWPEFTGEYRKTWLDGCPSFERFVMEALPQEEARQIPHFWPGIELLRDEDGEIFAFDFIARYETLPRDFEIMRRRINPKALLRHENRSVNREPKDYREVYTTDMKAIVAGLFGESIAALGYTFDGFDDTVPAIAGRRGY